MANRTALQFFRHYCSLVGKERVSNGVIRQIDVCSLLIVLDHSVDTFWSQCTMQILDLWVGTFILEEQVSVGIGWQWYSWILDRTFVGFYRPSIVTALLTEAVWLQLTMQVFGDAAPVWGE